MFFRNVDASRVPRVLRLILIAATWNFVLCALLVLAGLLPVGAGGDPFRRVQTAYMWISQVVPFVAVWLILPFSRRINPVSDSTRARSDYVAVRVSIVVFSVFGIFWVVLVTKYFAPLFLR